MNEMRLPRTFALAAPVLEGVSALYPTLDSADGRVVRVRDAAFEEAGSDSAFGDTLRRVLDTEGFPNMNVESCHLLQACERLSKPIPVRDILAADDDSTICIILCIRGEGNITFSQQRARTQTIKSDSMQLKESQGVVYRCNVTYALDRRAAAYLHCVCGRMSTAEVQVHFPVKFACPYNSSYLVGDVRLFPRSYTTESQRDCHYRGSKWKNVLDHLKFCKGNPMAASSLSERKRRQAEEPVSAQCPHCDNEPFGKRNSLIQHIARKHKGASGMSSSATTPAIEAGDRASGDVDDFDWLLGSDMPAHDSSPTIDDCPMEFNGNSDCIRGNHS